MSDEFANMTEFSMERVVEILKSWGDDSAYVEQTGGGCATIYAGGVLGTVKDYGEDAQVWGCLAGPGWFDGPQWREARGHTMDFNIGPEGSASYDMKWPDPLEDNLNAEHLTGQKPAVVEAVIAAMIWQRSQETAAAWREGRVTVNDGMSA